MGVIGVTADGRKIVKQIGDTITVPIGGANQGVVVRVNDLSRVENIVQVNVVLDPVVSTSLPTNIDYDGNLVGMTIVCGAGTTLTPHVIAVGY